MLVSRDLRLTYSVSTGNEAASGAEDYLDYLIDEPNTRVIAMIIEQFRAPQRVLSAIRKARLAGKIIVLLHPGKSSAARDSAATHTGAMAGDDKLMRVKVARAGAIIAESLEELGDITEIAARCVSLPSGGTVILGESGAFKALMLDHCEELSLPLTSLDDHNSPALRAALPDFVPVSNPLDVTAQGLVDPDMYYRILDALFKDGSIGTVVAGIIQSDPVTANIKLRPILRAVQALRPTKPMIFAGLDEGAIIEQEKVAALRAAGVTYFPTTERAFRAIKRVHAYTSRNFRETDASSLHVSGLPVAGGVIPEYRAKAILTQIGINFPRGQFAATLDDALAAAISIGWPVVMKAQSAQLSHKSDAGGVALNLRTADELTAAWIKMKADVARYNPDILLEGILVESMGARGLELIIGAKNDPDWGPVVLVGFGGVTAEILQDVRLLTPDLTIDAIVSELNLLKSAALLHGYRGSPALDIQAAAELVAKVGRLMVAEPGIREIDLNPVVLYPKGQGVVALDALMIVDAKSG
jgi:acetate---CoA ligase (ADP-forming)